MVEKKINIFSNGFDGANLNNAELFIEISDTYIILSVLSVQDKKIIAYEYFEFDSLNNVWSSIIQEIKTSSKILGRNYNSSRLFYNSPEVLVVPALYGDNENAKLYLNTFYNSLKNKIIGTDNLSAFDNVNVIYAVEEELKQAVQNNFNPASAYHSYSKLLQNISQSQSNSSQQLHLFFYNRMFVPVLTTGSAQLMFVKSANYHTSDDILYFVLNVLKQYDVNIEQVEIKVSGFINADSDEFMVLQKSFSCIVIEEPHETKYLNKFFKGFPKHYFTPFFYLLA